MPGGDLPKLHSETLQQDRLQGNFPCRFAIGMVFVMNGGGHWNEANLTTTPLEPLNGAWICRSYWQDTVETWRCPVAVAQLHEMTWPQCNISPASIFEFNKHLRSSHVRSAFIHEHPLGHGWGSSSYHSLCRPSFTEWILNLAWDCCLSSWPS